MINLIFHSFLAIIATLGFCILFNVKKKNIPAASISGGISWFTYLILTHFNMSQIFALLIASVVMSTYSEIMARKLKTPAASFLICGMIPLVPGGGMYYTMYESVTGNSTSALFKGFNTIAQAIAIAIGIFLVYSIFKLLSRKKYHK